MISAFLSLYAKGGETIALYELRLPTHTRVFDVSWELVQRHESIHRISLKTRETSGKKQYIRKKGPSNV